MKVLLVTVVHWSDMPTGSAKIAFEEAEELCRRGEDVWVLALGSARETRA